MNMLKCATGTGRPSLAILSCLIVFIVASSSFAVEGIAVDKDKKTITIDAKIAPRKINDDKFKEIYPIEVIASWPYPKGRKAHETVLTIDVKPSDVHKALEELGLKAGTPVEGDGEPKGPEANLWIDLPGDAGGTKRVAVEKVLVDPKTNKPLPKLKWRFTGSVMTKPDPTKDDMVYGADLDGCLISIFPVTNKTVFQTNLTMKEEKYLKLETDKTLLPKEGTPVKLVIELTGK
jgi:signal recognition particle subunit SEC65